MRARFPMNLFLGDDRIYRRAVTGTHGVGVFLLVSIISILVVVAFVVVLVAYLANRDTLVISVIGGFLLLAVAAVVFRGLARKIAIHKVVKSRNYRGRIDLKASGPEASRAGVSVLLEEAKIDYSGERSAASFKAQIIDQGPGWWLYDATSVVYNDKKRAIAERSYTVFEAKLRQPTPHLVFDSKLAKGRQFRAIYSGSQQLKGVLGDGLDQLFVVYSPIHHTIETLSFITPEVIEAIIGLDDCDIEFVDNSLLCYTSFLPPQSLDSFVSRCQSFHGGVNDNLRLYQPPEDAVKPFGRRLLKDYWNTLLAGLLIFVLGSSFVVFGVVNWEKRSLEAVVDGGILALSGAGAFAAGLKTRSDNRRAKEEFLKESGR